MLLAFIRESDSIFNSNGIQIECDIDAVRTCVAEFSEKPATAVHGKLPFDLESKLAIEYAISLNNDDLTFAPQHLFVGILHDQQSIANRVLLAFEVDTTSVVAELKDAIADNH